MKQNNRDNSDLHKSVEGELALGDVKGRAVKGVASLLVRQGVIRALGFVGMLFLARILAPEMFGVFIIAQFVIMFFEQISNMGLSATLLRKKDSVTEAELRTVFTIQQVVAVVSLVIILFTAPLITAHYEIDESYTWLIRVMGIALVLASLKTIPSVLLQRQLRHDKLSLAEIAEHVIYNVVAITLAVLGFEVWSLVIATLARGVTGTGLLYAMAWWRPRFGFHIDTAREIMRFGIPIQLANFAVLANNAVIPVMVGSFLGAASVGYVNFAKKMLDALSYQPLVLAGRVQLRVFGRVQDDRKKLASTAERSLFLGAIIVTFMLAMLVSLASPFVEIVVTEKWRPSIILIYIFAVGYVAHVILQPCTQLLKSIGDAKSPLIIAISKFVIEILLFLLLYPQLGLVGYSIAYVIAILMVTGYAILKARPLLQINFMKSILPPLLAAGLAGLSSFAMSQLLQGVTGMLTGLVAGTVVFFYSIGALAGDKLGKEIADLAQSVSPKSTIGPRIGDLLCRVYRMLRNSENSVRN